MTQVDPEFGMQHDARRWREPPDERGRFRCGPADRDSVDGNFLHRDTAEIFVGIQKLKVDLNRVPNIWRKLGGNSFTSWPVKPWIRRLVCTRACCFTTPKIRLRVGGGMHSRVDGGSRSGEPTSAAHRAGP